MHSGRQRRGQRFMQVGRWQRTVQTVLRHVALKVNSRHRESSIKLNNISVRSYRPKSELPFTDGQLRQAGLAGQPTFPRRRSGLAPTANAYEIALSCQRTARGRTHGIGRIFIEYLTRAPERMNDRTSKTLSKHCGRQRILMENVRYSAV